jgi:hypothetical protein
VKCTGHLPGPYTIPNVSSNVYCVYTNRTPATAMRGFGITGVDFAIECHMDKVAETVRMNPIELRILNAYRDGDMKAHRRAAKNCALIESCQVAGQKAQWPIRPEFAAMSSLRDGGGERANIPQTMIDDAGRIGERKRGSVSDTAPAKNGRASTNPPLMIEPVSASQAMGQEVQNIAGKPNLTNLPAPERVASGPTGNRPPAPARVETPAAAASLYQPVSGGAPSSPAAVRPEPPAPNPAPNPAPAPDTAGPPAPASAEPAAEPYKPAEPFSRGTKRPGVPSFISGTRRR